jgi:predicted O-methyltransferase YrrM
MIRRVTRAAERYLQALAGAAYAFTFGFASARNRRLVYSISDHFRPVKLTPADIPAVGVDELTRESGAIALRAVLAQPGNASVLELVVLARLVRQFRPHALFEIGTFDGRTTLNLAANSPEDAVVYTLDLPREQLEQTQYEILKTDRLHVDKDASGARFAGADCAGKIRQLYGDSATFDFAPYEGQIDFVFVDGSHAYEYVLNDTRVALQLLRGGRGVIVWHDYGGVFDFAGVDDVTRALNRLYAELPEMSGCVRVEGTTLAVLVRE